MHERPHINRKGLALISPAIAFVCAAVLVMQVRDRWNSPEVKTAAQAQHRRPVRPRARPARVSRKRSRSRRSSRTLPGQSLRSRRIRIEASHQVEIARVLQQQLRHAVKDDRMIAACHRRGAAPGIVGRVSRLYRRRWQISCGRYRRDPLPVGSPPRCHCRSFALNTKLVARRGARQVGVSGSRCSDGSYYCCRRRGVACRTDHAVAVQILLESLVPTNRAQHCCPADCCRQWN